MYMNNENIILDSGNDVASSEVLELNNNQCRSQKNNDKVDKYGESLSTEDVTNDTRTKRKRPNIARNGKSADKNIARETCSPEAQLHVNSSAVKRKSITSSRQTSTDEHETFSDNASDYVSTTSSKRANLDSYLPIPRLRFRTAAMIVFSVSVLCFCVGFDADLVFDDRAAVLENPDVLSETPWTNVFRNDFWGRDLHSKQSHKSYRPLTTLSFRLTYYLAGGFNPVWFHVPNILLHAIISVLLLRIYSILFGGFCINLDTNERSFMAPKSAFLCAILFAVHPIHAECVAGVVGRADLLCSFLFLSSFLMYIRSCAKDLHETPDNLKIYRPTRFSVPWMMASMLLCFLSVFCKEQGLTVLGICSAYDLIVICRIIPPLILRRQRLEHSAAYSTGKITEAADKHSGKHANGTSRKCDDMCRKCNQQTGKDEVENLSFTIPLLVAKTFSDSDEISKHSDSSDKLTCNHRDLNENKKQIHVVDKSDKMFQDNNDKTDIKNSRKSRKLVSSHSRRSWIGSVVKRHVFLLATGMVTMWIRMHVMGQNLPEFEVFDNPHSFAPGPFIRGLNYNYLYSLNAWILLNPWWLCCDWSMGCISVIMTFSDPRILGGLALWTVLGTLLYVGVKQSMQGNKRILSVALAFLMVPFLPASNLFFRVGFVIAERILYLPSVGFCMLVVLGIRQLCFRYPRRIKIVGAGVFFLVCLFSARCVQRTTDWRSNLSLTKSGLSICPLNAKIHNNHGYYLAKRGRDDDAMEHYKEAIRLNPLYYNAFHNLGGILIRREKYAEAEKYIEKAIEIKEDFAKAWLNLGVAKEHLQKYGEAEKCYLTSLHYQPEYPNCLYNMGRLYLRLKDHNKAINTWWKAVELEPREERGWYNIAVVLHNQGRFNEAAEVLNRGLSNNPEAHKLRFLLADTYKKGGNWRESEKAYLEAIRNRPGDMALYFHLGILYQDWKKYDLAERYYRECLKIQPNSTNVIKKLATLPYHE